MAYSPDLGAALASARAAADSPTFEDLYFLVRSQLGESPTAETLRAWHGPKCPAAKNVDMFVLGVLADRYGINLSDLHPVVARKLRGGKDVLARSRWTASTAA